MKERYACNRKRLPDLKRLGIRRIIFHEQVGRRAIAGTLVAIAGVALLLPGG
ncbi:MAG: hypothetical protein GY759_08115 [Chloroflexi bacterium]|nr:hypothetical protein [Chloroflexota bacterium]